MKRFAQLFRSLDETNKTTAKVEALAGYFRDAPGRDKVWTIALLSHRRPRRVVNTRLLREWAAEEAGLPGWLFEETYHIVGDLAETIANLLPVPAEAIETSLGTVISGLMDLRDSDEARKKTFILSHWRGMDALQRFVFNKILTGGFRVGVSRKLMTRALAKATGEEESVLAHRIMGEWDPSRISFDELVYMAGPEDDLSKPYPFHLAYPLEGEVAELEDIHRWHAERKWDGIRGQIILRNKQLFIWSRGEELITDKFPEFSGLPGQLPDNIVLDGEILPFKNGQPLPFQLLQTRIGRKNVSKKQLKEVPVVFIAFDILEWKGHDIRQKSFAQRRELLEKTLADDPVPVYLSEKVEFEDWEQLSSERERSRELHCEGIMLKHLDSVYETGRVKGGWWKWKTDPYTIDAVLTYAMRGHGRRSNLYTDFTFGLWKDKELVTFAKAYSGLTDEEMREVDRYVRQNTVERFGPVRQVVPELVFEIAFEGLAPSGRHKSGVAVRFPRILRWRKDKDVSEANSLDDLKSLLPKT